MVESNNADFQCDETGNADSTRGSCTRIRILDKQPAPSEQGRSASAAHSLLAGKERPLRLVARRLSGARRKFDSSWLEQCASCPELAQEDAEYALSIQRATAPLLDSLSIGQLERAELHACELFADFREVSLSIASVMRVIGAFEACALRVVANTEWAETIRDVGRFLTCIAVEVYAAQHTSTGLMESTERVVAHTQPSPQHVGLLGESESIRKLRAHLRNVARAPGSVLIAGASGTGKELVARAIHELGDRARGPLLAINCAALPRELIESELFGYERGAFTGSRGSAPGLLRAAGDGTLFLDEITEMPEALQPKLLRVLEQRTVRPVGGLKELPVGARIIAATNTDPERAVESGRLRADLFYRLCVHRVDVPPLTERSEDIPLLVRHFLAQLVQQGHDVPSEFAPESLALLSAYSWPGNVRELRNVVEHSCATAKAGRVEPEHLPRQFSPHRQLLASPTPQAVGPRHAPQAGDSEDFLSLKFVERRHIESALEIASGNKALAARMLGLSRHQLYVKLERLRELDSK